MDASRNSLYHIQKRAYAVFNREAKQNRHTSKILLDKAFPKVPYSENKHINVKGMKSPYDGDMTYWSERNSKLYDNHTSKALKRQNHSCDSCGLKFVGEEKVHLHHVDGNHDNWKTKNLVAIHRSCHQLSHMSNSNSKFEKSGGISGEQRVKLLKHKIKKVLPVIKDKISSKSA